MHDEAACHADPFFCLHDLGHGYLSPMSALNFANKGLSPGCLAGLQAEWFDRTELESQDRSVRDQ